MQPLSIPDFSQNELFACSLSYLKVAVWLCWWKGHWNREEVPRMPSDAKFHATTLIWWVNNWELPLKNRMLMIIVVFAINFTYDWPTYTMSVIDRNKYINFKERKKLFTRDVNNSRYPWKIPAEKPSVVQKSVIMDPSKPAYEVIIPICWKFCLQPWFSLSSKRVSGICC